MSSSSAFHGGDVASAIQSARASARPLLVALHPGGDDARSASLDAVWADDDVRGELGDHWVAVRLEASTAAHRNFAQIYPTHASRVPSVVALNPNDGSVLFASGDGDAAEQGVGTNVEATRDVLRATRAAFQKAMAAAAMAALARMAAATGAGSDAKTETTPSARTMSTTPGATAPSASASDPATDPSRETRADADERATNANAKAVSKKKTLVKTASLSAKGEVPVARPRTPSPIALRVTLADGSTIFGELPAGATLGDARACIVANEPHVANEAPFEIWNTWPRERLDGGEEGDARAIDAQTLESLGLGGRPSLLVIRPLARRGDANEKPRKQTMTMTNAARAAGGVVAALLELLRRVWATLAMFLGIGEGARAAAAFGTQDAAWAAATRGVAATSTPSKPAVGSGSRPRGGGGGARGNVHTLGSSGDADEPSDDRANRFDNGNSTVWGGDDGGEDGRGGGGTAADAF